MRARGWVVAGLLAVSAMSATAESKEPKPVAVDIKPFRAQLRVFQDAAGGTYVVLNEFGAADGLAKTRAWYGTGKTLYEQIIIGRSRDGDAWALSIWAPRVAETRPGSIDHRKDGSYQKTCDGKDDAMLSEVTGDKAKAILDKATFMTSMVVRRAHLFARDDAGIYYYVDRLSEAYGGKGYRVFVGRKGAMKQLSLTDVASDSGGEVFATKTGDLRLVKTNEDEKQRGTTWVKGGKRTTLIQLNTDVNSPIIFRDLGIYKFLGTVCDNI